MEWGEGCEGACGGGGGTRTAKGGRRGGKKSYQFCEEHTAEEMLRGNHGKDARRRDYRVVGKIQESGA